ncbi:MAG: ADP-ribosylglycohydrolase family protein, partial [Lachnospiraceae bacterium]|nr:ADP-ribosylglycohydrolase family protein [Lachnospiraceae bacterium]
AIWYKQFYSRYPFMGYGQRFVDWANAQELYVQNSYGNGAAMRITAIGYAFQHLEEVLKQTKYSCHYTHHSREAIRGAQAVAAAVFMAYHGESKEKIPTEILTRAKGFLDIGLISIIDEFNAKYKI